jgi:hypothetical protein
MKKLIPILILLSCQKLDIKHQPSDICYWNYWCGTEFIYFSKSDNFFILKNTTYYDWDYNKRRKILSGYIDNERFEFFFEYVKIRVSEIRDELVYTEYRIEITIEIDGVKYIYK